MALGQRRLIEFLNRSHLTSHRLGIAIFAPATAAESRVRQAPHRGLADDADLNHALDGQANHDGEFPILAGESARAVDGVDDPEPVRLRRGVLQSGSVFLGEKASLGKCACNTCRRISCDCLSASVVMFAGAFGIGVKRSYSPSRY